MNLYEHKKERKNENPLVLSVRRMRKMKALHLAM